MDGLGVNGGESVERDELLGDDVSHLSLEGVWFCANLVAGAVSELDARAADAAPAPSAWCAIRRAPIRPEPRRVRKT